MPERQAALGFQPDIPYHGRSQYPAQLIEHYDRGWGFIPGTRDWRQRAKVAIHWRQYLVCGPATCCSRQFIRRVAENKQQARKPFILARKSRSGVPGLGPLLADRACGGIGCGLLRSGSSPTHPADLDAWDFKKLAREVVPSAAQMGLLLPDRGRFLEFLRRWPVRFPHQHADCQLL